MVENFKTDAEIAEEKERLRLLALLPSRKFDVLNPPPKLEPTFTINGVAVATAGNIQAIQSKAKVGKSAFCGALIASLFETPDADTFGIEGSNPDGFALIHFDTEQSPQDHFAVVQVALTRAKAKECPDWVRSYWLVDIPMRDRIKLLEAELDCALEECGGIRAVILDGIADFIADPNDPAEAFALIEKLHALAVKYQCVIWLVLHENPGSESGKTRGHLGSQLERKSESNVRLEKDVENVTVAFIEKGRHGFIAREDGPRFKWCEKLNMHVSTQSRAAVKKSAKLSESENLVNEIFDDVNAIGGMTWEDVHLRIETLLKLSRGGARKRFARLCEDGLLVKNSSGNWMRKGAI